MGMLEKSSSRDVDVVGVEGPDEAAWVIEGIQLHLAAIAFCRGRRRHKSILRERSMPSSRQNAVHLHMSGRV
jgi:hypothetical protein